MHRWREVGPHEWWLLPDNAPEDPTKPDPNNVLYPPSLVISWGGPGRCCHLYRYSNGAMPGDEGTEDSVDYLHICSPLDLIAELRDFMETAGWKPQ